MDAVDYLLAAAAGFGIGGYVRGGPQRRTVGACPRDEALGRVGGLA